MQDNIPAAGYTLLSELDDLTWDSYPAVADLATAMNSKSVANGATLIGTFDVNAILVHANITDSKAQEVLNGTAYATIDLTHLASILYAWHDDWADNKLTSRDNRATTAASILGANEFAQKFRPEWTVQSGTWNADAGYVTKTNGTAHDHLSTPSTFAVGTWECDFKLDVDNSYIRIVIMNNESVVSATSDGYYVYAHGSSNFYRFDKRINNVSTTIINGGAWANHTTQQTTKVTRNISGDFELFLEGVSEGTVTDTDATTSLYIILWHTYVNCRTDNLKVY